MSDAPEGRLAQSVQWQTLNVGFQVLFQLAFIKALSIFLTEAEWGIIGIALGIIGIIEIFAQLGVGPSLIQRKSLTNEQISAAFWVSLLLGVLFGLTTFFTAPFIANFYHRPDLISLLRFIALSFPLAGLALVPRAMLIRKMDFRNLFWSSLIAMPIGNGVIGILAAYNGWGVYAYAGALLAQNALLGLNYWIRAGVRIHKPALAPAQPLFKYGASSTVFNFLNYAASRLDVLVLGRFLPESRNADQGIYDRSNYMMTLPITLLGKLSDSVLFSSMSEVQENRERLKGIFLGGTYFTACLVFPGVVLLELFTEEFVLALLDEKLLPTVPIIRILYVAVFLRSWIKVCDATVRATDIIGAASIVKAVFCAGLAFSAYLGYQHGFETLAWGVVVSTLLQAIAMLALIVRKLELAWSAVLSTAGPGVVLGLVTLCAAAPMVFLQEIHWLLRLGLGLLSAFVGVSVWAWIFPRSLQHGANNILAQIATRVPIAALKQRWIPDGDVRR
ncbi:MAG: oligosaccharide flippase family protein [Flavobacteriales bacterium]|nr:oligosaccharide flippase family protein [Flavobacteriales bacterium]